MSTVSIKRDLLNGLRDTEYRQAFNLENVYTTICFQLRALREQKGLSQAALGRKAKMAQERISILEDPNSETKPTLNTLLRLADAFDVGLDVRFIPFSLVIDRSTRTQFEALQVDSFDDEVDQIERDLNFEEKVDNAFKHAARPQLATGDASNPEKEKTAAKAQNPEVAASEKSEEPKMPPANTTEQPLAHGEAIYGREKIA